MQFPSGMELVPGQYEGCWVGRGGGILYREIPKAACSTLAQLVYHADHGCYFGGDIHDARDGIQRWPFDPDLTALARDGQAFVFSALRNPYARLVSAFEDKICTDQRDGKPYRATLRQMLWERYGVDLRPGSDRVPAFRRFLLFVRDVHVFGPSYWQDRHWTPQAQHLRSVSLNGIEFSHLFRIEAFAEGLSPVLEQIPPATRPRALPQFNQGRGRALPVGAYYDDLAIHLMQELYRWDFELFGYDRLDPDGAMRPLDLAAINQRLADPHAPHWAGLGS